MTKEAKLFNEKYNLNVSDASFVRVDIYDYASSDLSGKPKKNWKEVMKRFFTNPVAVIALFLFFAIFLMGYIIPATTSFDPNNPVLDYDLLGKRWQDNMPPTGQLLTERVTDIELLKLQNAGVHVNVLLKEPNNNLVEYDPWEYVSIVSGQSYNSVLGTDAMGMDIWTRTWSGTARSLELALAVVCTTTVIGTILGSYIGMRIGTMTDIVVMKVLTVYNNVPTFVWYSIFLFVLPKGWIALFVVFVVTGWQNGLGTARSQMWRYVNSDFMKVAETMGVSKWWRIMRHALPNYMGYIGMVFVQSIPGIISGEATLSFLGFSPNPDNASLGNVLNAATDPNSQIIPLYVMLPSVIMFTLTMSLHFVALGLNDAFDPRFKKS